MKARYIVLLTVAGTLLVQFFLSRLLPGPIFDFSRPAYEDALVLTNDVVLLWGTNRVGTLKAGQMLFQPCYHDLWLTDPGDPRIWKLYVSFGFNNGRDIVCYASDIGTNYEQRNSVDLERISNIK